MIIVAVVDPEFSGMETQPNLRRAKTIRFEIWNHGLKFDSIQPVLFWICPLYSLTSANDPSAALYLHPATWNSLPPAVISCDTLSVLKSRLKIHLFITAYS